MAGQNAAPLLKVEGLKQYFRVSKSYTVKAVDNVSFEIYPGETYGLVGESGSGKSTIGRSVIRLYDPTAGKITFDGQDISGKLSHSQNNTLRTQMQMIFQDPMASLNPRKKVEDIIGEGLDIHHMYKTKEERRDKVEKILAKVGLAPEHAERGTKPDRQTRDKTKCRKYDHRFFHSFSSLRNRKSRQTAALRPATHMIIKNRNEMSTVFPSFKTNCLRNRYTCGLNLRFTRFDFIKY